MAALPKALFLDRDGVLNVKMPEGSYVTSPEQFRWLPGVVGAMAALARRGVRLIVVTNQRGVARQLMTAADLAAIHDSMTAELAAANVTLAGIYACTHEIGDCDCRKPGVALFHQALADHPDLVLGESAVVGDGMADMLAAARLGIPAYAIVDDESRARFEGEARALGASVAGLYPSVAALVRDEFGLSPG